MMTMIITTVVMMITINDENHSINKENTNLMLEIVDKRGTTGGAGDITTGIRSMGM